MNLPINIMMCTLAVLPIVTLLVLMVKFQWGVAKAAPVGLIITIINSIMFFKAGIMVIGIELLKAVWNSFTVILVIFTAILMYEVTNEAKAFKVLKTSIEKIVPNELLRIMGIGVVFASFLQGVTGFGVPVAVTAPILIGLGVQPMWAVIIPLIGHSWAGTFGTLGIAWLSLIMQSGIKDSTVINQIAIFATGFIFLLNIASNTVICWFYGGRKAVKKGSLAILLISIAQGGGQILFVQINQVLACFLPSCIAFLVFFLLGKSKYYRSDWKITNSPIMNREINSKEINSKEIALDTNESMNIHKAVLPYYIMTIITMVVVLIPSINNFLGRWSVAPTFSETVTGYGVVNLKAVSYSPINPLTNAGTLLFISSLCAFIYYCKKKYISRNSGKVIVIRTFKKTIPPSIAIMSLIMMSRVMGGTGQITVLALGTAKVVGPYYSVVAPFIGVLGSFMTGSNLSCNMLFGDFQLTTSKLLELNTSAILGVHTAGGAIGTAISPGNIVLGTTTAGILGEEGKILKKILPSVLVLALVFGVILYII